MTWPHKLGWAALALATLAAAAAPDVLSVPVPVGALKIDRATYEPEGQPATDVTLPHAVYLRLGQKAPVTRYTFTFDRPDASAESPFLYIPSVNRRFAISFNGEKLLGFESSPFWTGPLSSTPVVVQLPRLAMAATGNRLTVTLDNGPYVVPSFLSPVYLGNETAVMSPYKWRNFLATQMKIMAVAGHMLLGFGLIFAYFFRPNDDLFRWLATFNVVSLVVANGMLAGYDASLSQLLPYFIILCPTMGLAFVATTLTIINIKVPRGIAIAAIVIPILLLPVAIFDSPFARAVTAGVTVIFLAVSYVTAAGLLTWGAFWRGELDARLMLPPTFLVAWFGLHDIFTAATLPRYSFDLLTTYPRPLYLAFITAVLMRRMGASLDLVDRANETLSAKLAGREAELAALHRKERVEATRLTREQERQRLTHDLHDGLSGHLVSIIALSERTGDKPTEQAAREALNDLRLVIYSLDLGDRELPLALANFRERLMPQLHRLGVTLDWSIAELPEVSGVTPGNALAILRILQEAITNALKHGPARRIVIRGAVAPDGMPAITIENDGRPYSENASGHGLANMRRRAQQLRGRLNIEAIAQGTAFTLLLPRGLPDFEEESGI